MHVFVGSASGLRGAGIDFVGRARGPAHKAALMQLTEQLNSASSRLRVETSKLFFERAFAVLATKPAFGVMCDQEFLGTLQVHFEFIVVSEKRLNCRERTRT